MNATPAPRSGGLDLGHLFARTRRVDAEVDLLNAMGDDGLVWLHDQHGFAGIGQAARIGVERADGLLDAEAVATALDSIGRDDPLATIGTGPVAFGALPFDPRRRGELVIPEVIVSRRGDGTRWVTTVLATEDPRAHDERRQQAVAAAGAPTAGEVLTPLEATIRSPRSPEDWCDAVAAARDDLRAGRADKVVLAREVLVETAEPLPTEAVLRALARAYPSCMVFRMGGFLGASPELLVSRSGDIVQSHPMAGTAPRSSDPTTDARLVAALLASTKDRVEHRYTIDMVHEVLLGFCSYLDEEPEPSVVAMANVTHLATRVEGRLSDPPASVLELVGALHPTPAVCGKPRDTALEMIGEYEQFDRGCYAGPVGWVDRNGNGTWAVAIRSAELSDRHGRGHARLFAGVGVVADSDPMAELAETRAKLAALLGAVLRP